MIANFLRLLYSYMGVSPDPKAPLPDAIKGRVMHHSFPVSLFQVGRRGGVEQRGLQWGLTNEAERRGG